MIPAHIRNDVEQWVQEHLKNVAKYSRFLGEKVGLGSCAELIGWLHDIGKFTGEFESYIRSSSKGMKKHQKGPDHSTAGAVWIMELIDETADNVSLLTAQIIAIVIMSHHGGLIDIVNLQGDSPFIRRLNKSRQDEEWVKQYSQVKQEIQNFLDVQRIKGLFDEAVNEVREIFVRLKKIGGTSQDLRYNCGNLCKYLYSCLIDADRYDTATFMDGLKMQKPRNNQSLWEELGRRFETKIKEYPAETEINQLRQIISTNCYYSARRTEGIYTLNCPTGSGKTMASLRFALQHAISYGKERIFYIIPFITITEQNASEIKKILSEKNGDKLIERVILELHSAKEADEIDVNEVTQAEMLAERLEHPMIFTTMVRFLNTFFSSGTKNIRGAHNFANSIIIFDEIQTLSPKCIAMFNELLNFLSEICGATIILSTATQPLLNHTPEGVPDIKIRDNIEISGCTYQMHREFKRTEFIDRRKPGGYTKEELCQMIWQSAEEKGNALIVFNTKAAVVALYDELKQCYGELAEEEHVTFYVLTTHLYPKHRKEKIDEIREKLKNNERIIVISTQLIEAGVDISFKTVFRSLAGLDSIIQSGGRCNRHGENAKGVFGQVYLINPQFESLGSLANIKKGKEAVETLLNLFEVNPEAFEEELSSLTAIEAYFKEYYMKQKENMTYKFKIDGQTEYRMYELLSDNKNLLGAYRSSHQGKTDRRMSLTQSFKTAGHYFKAIDEHGKAVIIQHGQGKQLVSDLLSLKMNQDKYTQLHRLQAYTVNISEGLFKQLGDAVACYEELGIYVLNEAYYDEIYGVSTSPIAMDFYNY